MSVWCGAEASVDYWSAEGARHLQSFSLDVELADVGSQVAPQFMPPGADANADNWPVHVLPVIDSAMNADGGHIALAAGRGVRVFRTSTDERQLLPSQNLRGHEQSVTRVALDAGGDRALSCDATGQVVVWDTIRGQSQHVLRISTAPCALGFIWNDMLAMAGDDTGRVICWELDQGRRHLQFQAHHGPTLRTSFNQDSGVLLTAGADNAARMWNLEEGKQIGQDMPHRSAVCDVAFAYAGRFVVTCGADGHVAIWNSTDGDLLDWHFDSAPVYRVSFDRLNGTLIAAGARTIKVLSVDWQRLREVDADARSSMMLGVSPADHAALFSNPDPTFDAPPGPSQAPVGSVMPNHQTMEMRVPEAFGDALRRTPHSPRPVPASGRADARENDSLHAVAFASARSRHASGSGSGSRSEEQANPFEAVGASNGVQNGTPSLAAAMAHAKAREQPNTRATAYGIGKGADSTTVDADAFFSALDSASESARMSRMESQLIQTAAPAAAGSRAAIPVGSRSRSSAARVHSPEEEAERARVAEEKAAQEAQLAKRRKLITAGVTAFVLAVATRVGVALYFTQSAWPGAVAAEASSAREAYAAATEGIEEEFADYEAEEQANIARYEDSASMTPEAAERAIARVQARVQQRREQRDALLAEAEIARDAAYAEIETERRRAAGKMANISALGVLLVSLLIGLPLALRKPTPEPTPPRRPGARRR